MMPDLQYLVQESVSVRRDHMKTNYSEVRDVKVPGPDLSNVVLILTRVDVNLSGLTETPSKEISLDILLAPR